MNPTPSEPALLETVIPPRVIDEYLRTISKEGPPVVVFNRSHKDIADRYGGFDRCFRDLKSETDVEVGADGGRSLPIQRAARCIDTWHLSEFLTRFLRSEDDWDYFECEGFSRHYVGRFTDRRHEMVGYYLVGPVTLRDVVADVCPFTLGPHGCPFAHTEAEIAELERKLETFRVLISEKYQTEVRRAEDAVADGSASVVGVPQINDMNRKLQAVYEVLIQKAGGDIAEESAETQRKLDKVYNLLFPDQDGDEWVGP